MPQILFILGMHRSGTSALAGSLYKFAELPVHSKLVKAVEGDNPTGYWEPVDVVNINNDIFSAFNMHYMDYDTFPHDWIHQEVMLPVRHQIKKWFEKNALDNPLLVVKDPRLCRTLPIWVDVLAAEKVSLKYIHIYRHPMDVISSLRSRDDNFSVVEGMLLWMTHVLDSFKCLALGRDNIIISYKGLMDNPLLTMTTIKKDLNLNDLLISDAGTEDFLNFLMPSLVHHSFKGDIPYPPLSDLLCSIFNCLEKYNLKYPDDRFCSCIKNFEMTLVEFKNLFNGALKRHFNQLKITKKNAEEQIAYRDALVTDIKNQLEAAKKNAEEQIAYRDALVIDIENQLKTVLKDAENQLKTVLKDAEKQISSKNVLLESLHAKVQEKDAVLGSRKEMVKFFFQTFLK